MSGVLLSVSSDLESVKFDHRKFKVSDLFAILKRQVVDSCSLNRVTTLSVIAGDRFGMVVLSHKNKPIIKERLAYNENASQLHGRPVYGPAILLRRTHDLETLAALTAWQVTQLLAKV